MIDYSSIFRSKLAEQAEVCARKALEWLQKDLQGPQELDAIDVYHLANAAQILLTLRDQYGEK
jgi:hypothetical protein